MALYLGSQKICPITEVKGDDSKGEFCVTVIDYDGTILKQDHLNAGDKMYMPVPPTHSNLTFQGWSCAEGLQYDGTRYFINVTADTTIGAYYTTVSGKTEIDIFIAEGQSLTFTCKMNGTKDWGDGTSDSTTSHTYATAGEYTIKVDATNWGATSSSSGTFGQSSNNVNYTVIAVRVGGSINTYNYQYVFSYCYALKYLSLKSTTNTSIGSYFARNCINLQSLIIPAGIRTIGSYAFYYCQQIQYPVIPSSITTINTYGLAYISQAIVLRVPNTTMTLGTYAFQGCSTIRTFKIPTSITYLNTSLFSTCTALQYIKIPPNIASVYGNAFSSDRGCVYDFSSHTSVPTLSGGAFNSIYPNAKILVPSSLEATWKTSTNWTTYANNIIGV